MQGHSHYYLRKQQSCALQEQLPCRNHGSTTLQKLLNASWFDTSSVLVTAVPSAPSMCESQIERIQTHFSILVPSIPSGKCLTPEFIKCPENNAQHIASKDIHTTLGKQQSCALQEQLPCRNHGSTTLQKLLNASWFDTCSVSVTAMPSPSSMCESQIERIQTHFSILVPSIPSGKCLTPEFIKCPENNAQHIASKDIHTTLRKQQSCALQEQLPCRNHGSTTLQKLLNASWFDTSSVSVTAVPSAPSMCESQIERIQTPFSILVPSIPSGHCLTPEFIKCPENNAQHIASKDIHTTLGKQQSCALQEQLPCRNHGSTTLQKLLNASWFDTCSVSVTAMPSPSSMCESQIEKIQTHFSILVPSIPSGKCLTPEFIKCPENNAQHIASKDIHTTLRKQQSCALQEQLPCRNHGSTTLQKLLNASWFDTSSVSVTAVPSAPSMCESQIERIQTPFSILVPSIPSGHCLTPEFIKCPENNAQHIASKDIYTSLRKQQSCALQEQLPCRNHGSTTLQKLLNASWFDTSSVSVTAVPSAPSMCESQIERIQTPFSILVPSIPSGKCLTPEFIKCPENNAQHTASKEIHTTLRKQQSCALQEQLPCRNHGSTTLQKLLNASWFDTCSVSVTAMPSPSSGSQSVELILSVDFPLDQKSKHVNKKTKQCSKETGAMLGSRRS